MAADLETTARAESTSGFLDESGILAGATVLVVDDGPANVALLERLLPRAGVARVVGITDPRDAVAAAIEHEPDLVILDFHMPHLDGVEVLEALTAASSDPFLPVLMLTADPTMETKQRALARGASDFVNKPFEQTELLLRVKNLLSVRALHLSLRRHNDTLASELRAHAARDDERRRDHESACERVRAAMTDGAMTMVFQPIVDLSTDTPMGYEALARFRAEPPRPPNVWFDEAARVGLGADLELHAIDQAFGALAHIGDCYLSVNASPASVLDPRLDAILGRLPSRTVLEITEHAAVDSYEALAERLDSLRRLGIRVAVDDAGSGYASLRHILRLAPDIIKLDIDLTRDIDRDPARRALAAALVTFATEIGAYITAEGVETESELDVLRDLGVRSAQGYLLGRPGPLS